MVHASGVIRPRHTNYFTPDVGTCQSVASERSDFGYVALTCQMYVEADMLHYSCWLGCMDCRGVDFRSRHTIPLVIDERNAQLYWFWHANQVFHCPNDPEIFWNFTAPWRELMLELTDDANLVLCASANVNCGLTYIYKVQIRHFCVQLCLIKQ
jgi:hypothetical protein